MNELIENGEITNQFYTKLILDNSSDYIIDNELYSIYRKGVEIISVPKWNKPSKDTYDRYVGVNWKYNLPRIYTIHKLNGMKNQKSILPFMKYQYKMNDVDYEKLQKQYNRFKNVLDITSIDSFSYNPPYDNIEPRLIEETTYDDNGNYSIVERMGYSGEEQRRLQKNIEYNKNYNRIKKKIVSAAIVYKEQIENLEFSEKDLNVTKINEILQILKRHFDERYIIKEKRYIILNKERGWNSLFYTDKEYKELSVRFYNFGNIDDKKKMVSIEREYLNKGIGLMKEKQNSKIINYGITWLQGKGKITIKDLVEITNLSKKTIIKHLKDNYRWTNKLFFQKV